jgi:hypothetical protein
MVWQTLESYVVIMPGIVSSIPDRPQLGCIHAEVISYPELVVFSNGNMCDGEVISSLFEIILTCQPGYDINLRRIKKHGYAFGEILYDVKHRLIRQIRSDFYRTVLRGYPTHLSRLRNGVVTAVESLRSSSRALVASVSLNSSASLELSTYIVGTIGAIEYSRLFILSLTRLFVVFCFLLSLLLYTFYYSSKGLRHKSCYIIK